MAQGWTNVQTAFMNAHQCAKNARNCTRICREWSWNARGKCAIVRRLDGCSATRAPLLAPGWTEVYRESVAVPQLVISPNQSPRRPLAPALVPSSVHLSIGDLVEVVTPDPYGDSPWSAAATVTALGPGAAYLSINWP